MRDTRQNLLANEGIGRLLIRLSLPAAVGMIVMALYNVVDTIFIGHAVGPLGIAGLTIVFPIQMLLMGVGMLLGIGGASLISRSLGAGDIHKAERTLGNAISLSIILGLLFTVIGLANSGYWARLFGASESIYPYAKGYLDIILMGTVFRIFAMSTNNLIRAEGNARVPMTSMIIGAGLNIVLDAIFILKLDMGVQGAAIATVISIMVSCLFLLSYYKFRNSTLKIRLTNLIPYYKVIKEIVSIGMASFARSSATSFIMILMNRSLILYGGDMSVATFGIVNRMLMFVLMPLMSIGQGLQPILGFSYGARNGKRALRAIKLSIIVSTIVSLVVFLPLVINAGPIIQIFTSDVYLITEATHAARLISLCLFLVGFQVVGSVLFQSIGKATPAFLTAISRQILFFLPLLLILPRFWKLDGIWLSYPVADVLAFLFTLLLFLPEVRKLRRMKGVEAIETASS
jgi:putative MATE family efflux protein